MFRQDPYEPYKGSKGFTFLKLWLYLKKVIRSKSRVSSFLRLLLVLLFCCLGGYVYKSAYKLELLDELRRDDLNIKNLEEKLVRQQFEPEIKPDLVKNENFIEIDEGITPEAQKFIKEFGLKDPGEGGKPVELPKNLSEDIQRRIKEGYDNYGYNAFVSSMIKLNRFLPDLRSEVCKAKTYTNLPKCSIIIPFFNDDWSLLMRTVHSIMHRSPLDLIEEILLVDDASDKEYLLGHLDEYVKKYPKIRVVRSFMRLGIISNRMFGAVNAVGPVLIFVDSHVEVGVGWLEPILDRFSKDMNVLAWPRVSSISDKDLSVNLWNENAASMGGFKWNMDFDWLDVKWFEKDPRNENKRTEMWDPKPSPTITGAVHAISKKFFQHVGMLDPEFDVWGGEDVELSFKVWLCGGKIDYVPCSFIAHMYKGHKFSNFPGKGGYRWNTDRIAETWLDEYKRYYYRMAGDTKDRKHGNVSSRIEIRKKIGCKPFRWFIENVYPNVPIPDNIKDPEDHKNVKNETKKQ